MSSHSLHGWPYWIFLSRRLELFYPHDKWDLYFGIVMYLIVVLTNSRMEAIPTLLAYPKVFLFMWASEWGILFIVWGSEVTSLMMWIVHLDRWFFMNKKISLTFGGHSLADKVNHVLWCLFHVWASWCFIVVPLWYVVFYFLHAISVHMIIFCK